MAYDPKIVAARLRQHMAESKIDQSDLASAIGVSQGAISQILTGRTRMSKHLPKIAENLAVNLAWLIGSTDQKIDMFDEDGNDISEADLIIRAAQISKGKAISKANHQGMAEELGGVRIKEIDLDYGMGASWIDGVPVTEVERVFPADWLVQFTRASPQQLFFAHGAGDSMMPTIMDRDIVLIDTTQQTVNMADRIWAVAWGGAGMIKRIRPQPDGGVRMMSDNPAIRDEVAYDGELSIIGRVVGVLRKV